uniref:Putative polyketide synthase n=1 Tax=Fusarium euwallaceae TaxID=1147111 RepID=A0A0U2LBZ5_9HYPO|nr:putative polyketide synthase [Fusarium euwallaceae]
MMPSTCPQTPTPIAIIGMGCRLPGGAENPSKLWDLLSNDRTAWSDVPPDRWNWESFHHPYSDFQEGHNQRGGHFIQQDIGAWDAKFFGVSPNEAKAIDPQQRILLETSYEALENAGIPLESIRGSDTAVYVATFSQDWETMMMKDTHNLAKYHVTGTHKAIVANRISYLFDLKGPSLSLDTACSGGLVALHQACQGLRNRESKIALVGGTNLILSPEFMFGMSFLNMLNDDGKSYSFDERGSGYGRGEGVATLVLKRLDDALQDGDPIRAVIRNTGVNQDGKTNGITYPSAESQEMLTRAVYDQAGLDPKETAYVEAHGTGTIAGDKIELGAVQKVFCPNKNSELYVGSVKANMGHLECTSGLAAVIKTALILEKGYIPSVPSLVHLKTSLRDIDKYGIKIPQQLQPWPSSAIRRASVQNFGFGGTNAHVILEALDASPQTNGDAHTNGVNNLDKNLNPPRLFVISAKSKDCLRSNLSELQKWVSSCQETLHLGDLAHTLASRRSLMAWRASYVASSAEDLASSLERVSLIRSSRHPPVVFLFTGQGAQWFAMGRELLQAASPSIFRDSILKSDKILKSLGLTWSLVEELQRDKASSQIDKSEFAQPASTAIQIALVDLLKHLRILPEAVVGHSSGEIAAAYAAGALNQEEALTVSFCRSQITSWCHEMIPTRGAMLAAGLGEASILPYIQQVPYSRGIVSVACINSPVSTTLTGDKEAVEDLQKFLEKASVFNRLLKVDTAYHSHHMRTVAPRYLDALGDVRGTTLSSTGVRFFSSVTTMEKTFGFGSEYWVKNLVSQVRFSEALESLCRCLRQENSGIMNPVFIEIGPHAALKGPFGQTLKALNLSNFEYEYTSALVRLQDARQSVLSAVGKLFELGYPVNVDNANSLGSPALPAKVISDLPTYCWDHSAKYWHESRLSKEYRLRQHPYHDLLGLRVISGNSIDPTWRQILSVDRQPWLADHVVDGFKIFPGSGYVCMAIQAAWQLAEDMKKTDQISHIRLQNVRFIKALVIPDSPDTVEVQIILRRGPSSWREFVVAALSAEGQWSEHCRGLITAEYGSQENEVEGTREEDIASDIRAKWVQNARDSCKTELDHDTIYSNLERNGNIYGPTFADIVKLNLGDHEAVATVRVPDIQSHMPGQFMQRHLIHPTTLDAITHVFLPLQSIYHKSGSVMPTSIGEIILSPTIPTQAGRELEVVVGLLATGAKIAVLEKGQTDLRAEPVVSMSNLETVVIGEGQKSPDEENERNTVLHVDWETDADFFSEPSLRPTTPPGKAAIDHHVVLARGAALHIRSCINNISRDDEAFDPSALTGYRKHLFKWMQDYTSSQASKMLLADVSMISAIEILSSLPKLGVEGDLLSTIGPNLIPIVKGEMDPLPLLLEEGRLGQVQENIETGRKLGVHVGHYLSSYAIKRPRMKILEIGSSTGFHTGDILETFEGRNIQSYDLTDVSLWLLQQLKSSFSNHEGVNFKALDINQDPFDQGFGPESYDVVIVNNVLRIANSLDKAIKNARKLLVPGGALVLLGMRDPSPTYDLIFGMMESAWSSQHSNHLPLPSPAEWEQVLSVNGFSGLEPATKSFDRVGQSCYCAVSTALASTKRKRMPINIITNTEGKLLNFAGQFSSILATNGMASSISGLTQHKIAPESLYVVLDEGSDPLLANPSSARFSELKTFALKAKSVLWVSMRADGANSSSAADMNMVTGFTRVARKENESLKLVSLVVRQDFPSNLEILRVMLRIMEISFYQQRSPTCELEYEYTDGRVLVPRVRAAANYQRWIQSKTDEATTEVTPFFSLERPLKMESATPGLFSSIRFTDDEPRGTLGPLDVEIEAKGYGLNSTDVDTALGQVKEAGMSEWAGIITAVGPGLHGQWKVGDRVFGLGGTSPFASNPRVSNPTLMRKMPALMTFTEAASLPKAFVTAYHALTNIAKLEAGQSVLIHAADEPTGQAVIMISQMMGAEIFTTVKDSAGRTLIRDEFHIPETHIFSSQFSTFREGVLRQTAGKGVDIIINSLGGSRFEDTWACLAGFGTFIDIGYGDSPLTMTTTDRNAVFVSLNLGLLVHHRPNVIGEVLDKVMELFSNDRLRMVSPLIKMPIADIEDAFRLHSKTQSKIVLEIGDGAMVKATVPRPAPLSLSPDATYVIAGGLGNLGLKICPLLASHGAKHIVALSRSGATRHSGHREALEKELEALGAKLYLPACDITDEGRVHEVAKWCAENLPPVRGVIQSATLTRSQDGTLENMDAQLFNGAVRPKRIGTLNLHSAFASNNLDFFVMVSSAAAILGTKGQAHYNSGNSFEEGFARQQLAAGSKTHFTTIMPALIGGSDADTTGPERRQMLFRQGATIVEFDEVISMVEYAVGTQAPRDGYSQLIVGIDPNAIPNDGTYNYPFFTDILQTKDLTTSADDEAQQAPVTLSQKLAAATTPQGIHDVVSEAVTTKIRELIAIGPDDLRLDVPLPDLGIDSLVAIEIKNWIGREFEAPLQTSQVLDASSIITLTDTIVQKSKRIEKNKADDTNDTVDDTPMANGSTTDGPATNGSVTNGSSTKGSGPVQKPDKSQELVQENGHPKHGFDCCAASEELPILPLLDLDTVLDLYFGAIKHLLTPPELEHMVTLLQRLSEPGGMGRKLHARLMDRFNNPTIDNWLFKPYLETIFTGRNYPVSPFSTFAGSDTLSKFPHKQAERAAIVSLAALEFKQKLESGKLELTMIGGRPQCMYLHGWLFNSFREALPGIDEMRKMPSENYIAVLRRGHLFKVNLTDEHGQQIPFAKLESTFQAILDKVNGDSWVGILTADERDSWAEMRQVFKNLSPDNKRYLDMVEGAAFVVSLDDGAPTRPFERMKSWQLNDGFNRWFDKGLKFVVCSNGVSGSVVEHSMIDGMTVRELYDATGSAILNYRRDGPDTLDSRNGVNEIKLEEYTCQSSPAIDERIAHVRARYLQETSIIGFTTWECVNFGQEYLQLHKVPAKGIFETMVQLASKYFLGENHPCWSAISMGHAHKGRPEIIQTYTAELKAFCDAADDSSIEVQKRQTLLFAAARSHVANVNRVQQGKGYERTMSAMQTVLKEDEQMPELYNDPTYISMRPHWLMTGSTDLGGSGGGEFGMVLRYPDSVWVQYIVDAASAKFSIVTGRDRTQRFCECMERAAKLIHELLEVE